MIRIVLLLILLGATSFNCLAVATHSIDELIAEFEEKYKLSGTVLVVKNGEISYSQAVGNADDVTSDPNTVHTQFDIGSIQKNLTAVLILQAVDNELIKLSDSLEAFDFEFSDSRAQSITIQQLLEHRSGFADIFTAAYRESPSYYDSLDKRLAILKEAPLLFEPGTDRHYSNYGYVLLGAILEKVTGKNYWELVEQNLLKPARTHIHPSFQVTHQSVSATPYHFNFASERVAVAASMREHLSPAGGGELSILELYGFYHALFDTNQFLSPQGLQTFRALQSDPSQWLSFGGGRGVSTAVEIDFENDLWVMVLANTDRLVAEKLSTRLRSYLLNGEYTEVKAPPEIFAYQFYLNSGAEVFNAQFKSHYEASAYQVFIGRVITNLARELVAADDAESSIFFFSYLTQLFPTVPDVYDGLAFGYFEAGDTNRAQQAFMKAVGLMPGYESQFNANNYEVDTE